MFNIGTHIYIWTVLTHVANSADCIIFRYKSYFNEFYAKKMSVYVGC